MKMWIVCIGFIAACLFAGLAQAQAVAVDYTKAKASWTEATTAGVPTSFTLKCGATPGGPYPLTKNYPIAIPLTTAGGSVLISDLINATGTYSCVVSATGLIGESANSTEVTFQAGRVPAVPAGLAILP